LHTSAEDDSIGGYHDEDSRVKELAKRLALAAVAFSLSVLACDLLYRWIVEPEPVVPKSLGRFDDTLGWALRPNTSASSTATDAEVHYAINGQGMRDDEVTEQKPESTFRIVLLGDSRTFGYGVPVEQHFSRLIEGYFTNVEAINLGVSGYGVDQELLALRTTGLRYRPDLVIAYVAHFGDQRHLFADRWGHPKPVFHVSGDSLVLTNVPVPSRYAGLDLAHRIDLALTERSPLYRDASHVAIRLLKKALGRETPAPAAPTTDTDTAFVNRLYDVALAILKQMNRETSRAGARFVLVTQLPRLHHAALREGLISLDVAAPLANPLFDLPHNQAHINAAGNGVLAWELASFLAQQNLIPAVHRAATGRRAEAGS
jgi:hypothetical protein